MTEETLNNVNIGDVKQFYRANYVPVDAYLTVVGDVKFEEVKEKVSSIYLMD